MFIKLKTFVYSGLYLFTCVLTISCAASVPQQTFLDRTSLSATKNVAIIVSANPLEVSYSQSKQGITSGVLFGLLGAAIEGGIRQNEDKESAEKVGEKLHLPTLEENMARSFMQELHQGGSFQKMEYVRTKNPDRAQLSSANYDSIIRLSVNQISLSKAPDPDDNLSLQINVKGQLQILQSGRILWDREVYLIGSDLQSLDYYKTNGLSELNTLLEKASQKLARDFIYLK